MKRVLGTTALAASIALLTVGCAADFSGSTVNERGYTGMESVEAAGDGGFVQDYAAEELGDLDDVEVGSHVIVTGYMTILTDKPAEAAKEYAAAIKEIGGYADSEWQYNSGADSQSDITLRVPADKFDEAVEIAEGFGKVQDKNVSREDVSAQVVDLEARKQALQDSLERLTELMGEAQTVSDLLEAENMKTQRQAELDSLVAQLDWYQDQTQMSTLSVTFTKQATVTTGFSWDRAVQMLKESFEFLIYALVVLLPWAAVGTGVAFLIRALVKRGRRRKASAPAQPTAQPKASPTAACSQELASEETPPTSPTSDEKGSEEG